MIRALVLDLDGTVYRGDAEVPGAGAFVRAMQDSGVRCLFVTNRANRRAAVVAAHMRSYGISCPDADVLTTAETAAEYVAGRPTYLIGETGIREAFAAARVPVTDQAPDFVVASLDREFTYAKLQTACRLIRGGARFILTNPDAWLQLDDGIMPGAGAIGAAIEIAGGSKPTILGKPEPVLFEKAIRMLAVPRDTILAIGDNLETDIPAARRAGMRSVLMLTGVSTEADAERAAVPATLACASYADLERAIRQENAGGPAIADKPRAALAGPEAWIREYDLKPHPEGGHYRETYRASESIGASALPARHGGARALSTAILFVLGPGEFSAFHRLKSDEIWHVHGGSGLLLQVLHPDGRHEEIRLGLTPGARVQAVVPAGAWFAAEPAEPDGCGFVGCTVAPGFDFADFELARRDDLVRHFPAHRACITRLTR